MSEIEHKDESQNNLDNLDGEINQDFQHEIDELLGLDGQNQSEINHLQEENKELKDQNLRLMADFENFRKRSAKERLELISTASADTLTALLPVLDDFDRAKKIADEMETKDAFVEGALLVYNKLKNSLKLKGLEELESTGEVFNPDLHEAVTKIPVSDSNMKGKVVDTIEKGYLLHDKLIRHAKVVVGD